ncbi:hypothetical protein PGH42_00015 [Legionella pneumophila]|nr:hypothetical protein PGH42_00015 [Legionella pneumophila]
MKAKFFSEWKAKHCIKRPFLDFPKAIAQYSGKLITGELVE